MLQLYRQQTWQDKTLPGRYWHCPTSWICWRGCTCWHDDPYCGHTWHHCSANGPIQLSRMGANVKNTEWNSLSRITLSYFHMCCMAIWYFVPKRWQINGWLFNTLLLLESVTWLRQYIQLFFSTTQCTVNSSMLIPDPLRVPKDLNYEIVAPSNNTFNQWLTMSINECIDFANQPCRWSWDCWRLGGCRGCLGLSASSDMIIYLNLKK